MNESFFLPFSRHHVSEFIMNSSKDFVSAKNIINFW